MNEKGYTLLEVIVSISMLTIASITLAGSFGTIIHFMQKSNEVKEASNAMYGMAEGSETVEHAKVKTTPVNITINDKVIKDVAYNQYTSDITDDVDLKTLSFEKNDNLKNLFQIFLDNVDKAEQECDDDKMMNQCVIDKVLTEPTQLPENILPNNLSDIRGTLYANVAYPFPSQKEKALIFVINTSDKNLPTDINVFMFYDMENKTWYCINTMSINSKLKLQMDRGTLTYGNKRLTSYSDLINEMKNDSDWNKTSFSALFGGNTPDKIWESINEN